MAIINKPHTFVALTTKSGEASQVNADFDALYTEVNGNLDDANIKAQANINQSKILNLTADLLTITNRKGWVLLESKIPANDAFIDFTTNLTNAYDEYMFSLTDVVPAIGGGDLWVRVSQASTFLTGGTDYKHARFGSVDGAAVGAAGSAGDSKIVLAANVGNLCGDLKTWNPTGTAKFKLFNFALTYFSQLSEIASSYGGGAFKLNTVAIDGIRFMYSNGNILSGIISLYGLRK